MDSEKSNCCQKTYKPLTEYDCSNGGIHMFLGQQFSLELIVGSKMIKSSSSYLRGKYLSIQSKVTKKQYNCV